MARRPKKHTSLLFALKSKYIEVEYIFLNGNLINKKDAYLHVSDLSIHRGYGVFDFFKIKNGDNPWLVHYMDRFYNSLKYARIPFEYSRDDLKKMVFDIMAKNGTDSGYIKIVATGGYSVDGYSPGEQSNFMMFSFPLSKFPSKPEGQGYHLIASEFVRPNPLVKSTNYFNSVLHYNKMQEYEAVDILYHFNGFISECSRCNVFIIKDGKISTPGSGMLEGITRRRVLEQIENGFDIEIRPVTSLEIFTADEIFVSSSTKGVMPIVKIEGKKVNDGTVGSICKELSHYLEVF
ncbi:MAG: aminotransferase class IV [Saprospiraceae bacterium]